jgi:riboflavin synthase alpha subunit
MVGSKEIQPKYFEIFVGDSIVDGVCQTVADINKLYD